MGWQGESSQEAETLVEGLGNRHQMIIPEIKFTDGKQILKCTTCRTRHMVRAELVEQFECNCELEALEQKRRPVNKYSRR
jgi:hypothetical protein